SSTGVDLKTGRPQMVEEKKPITNKVVYDICPAAPGAKDWQPTSFSPRTGMLYIPHQNLCNDEEVLDVGYIQGTPYVGANVKMNPGPGRHRGHLDAWDVVNANHGTPITDRFHAVSRPVSTGSGVVAYGTMS